MNVDITNHLVPWTTVKELLRGAWQEGFDSGYEDASIEAYDLTTNPYQED